MSDLIKRKDALKQLHLDHKDIIYINKVETAARINALDPVEPMPEYIEDESEARHYINGMVAMNETAFRKLMRRLGDE